MAIFCSKLSKSINNIKIINHTTVILFKGKRLCEQEYVQEYVQEFEFTFLTDHLQTCDFQQNVIDARYYRRPR